MKFYPFDKTLPCPVFVRTKPFSQTELGTLSKVAANKARYYAVKIGWIDKGRYIISFSFLANSMPRRSFYGAFFHFYPLYAKCLQKIDNT